MKKKFSFLFGISLMALSGCATYYEVACIPDTPEGLAAYRQCATSPHFQQQLPCMAGIQGFQHYGPSKDKSIQRIMPGCRQIVMSDANEEANGYWYSIQACNDKSDAAGSYRDANGTLHITH